MKVGVAIITAIIVASFLTLCVDDACIGNVNDRSLKFNQSECMHDIMPEDRIEWSSSTKTLVAYITTTGCDVQFSLRKEGNKYILSATCGDCYCKCLCTKRIEIYNVSESSEVIFIDRNGKSRVIGKI